MTPSYGDCCCAGAAGGSIKDYTLAGAVPDVRYPAGGLFAYDAIGQSVTPTVLTMYGLPYYEGRGGTLDRITMEVTGAQAGREIRVGIYQAVSLADPRPAALVVDGGTFSFASTGIKDVVINQVLSPNTLYWIAFLMEDLVTGTIRKGVWNTAQPMAYPVLGVDGTALTAFPFHAVTASPVVFGALPDPFPAPVAYSGAIGWIGVRYSA